MVDFPHSAHIEEAGDLELAELCTGLEGHECPCDPLTLLTRSVR